MELFTRHNPVCSRLVVVCCTVMATFIVIGFTSHPVYRTWSTTHGIGINTNGLTVPPIHGSTASPQKLSLTLWWQDAVLDSNLKVLQMEIDWTTVDFECRDKRNLGVSDGAKWVCFDEPYSPLRPDRNCVVYSFGINHDFSFDDAMAKLNCSVFSFDPSMGVKDHNRSARVRFFNLGLGAKDMDVFMPRKDQYTVKRPSLKWSIRKLSSIMKMLGHSRGSITILKMDIEGYEWEVLGNMLDEGVLQDIPQFLVEWHIFPVGPNNTFPDRKLFPKMHADYVKLKRAGFKMFSGPGGQKQYTTQANIHTQAETYYVNTQYSTAFRRQNT